MRMSGIARFYDNGLTVFVEAAVAKRTRAFSHVKVHAWLLPGWMDGRMDRVIM